jgi:hypothetical protein
MEANTEWPKMIKPRKNNSEQYAIDGIISDNRLGVLSKKSSVLSHTN